jgi:ribosomal protein S1
MGPSGPEKLKSILKPGDSLNVKILSIDLNRERVSLSLQQVPPEQQVDWFYDRLDAEPEEGV